MKKIVSIAVALAFVFGVTLVMAATAPKKVTLKANPKKVVEFPHKIHSDQFKCEVCHHKWDKKGEPKACLTCHKKKKGAAPRYFKAFHDRKVDHSCLGCHKKMAKDGKKAGPTKCAVCHPKK